MTDERYGHDGWQQRAIQRRTNGAAKAVLLGSVAATLAACTDESLRDRGITTPAAQVEATATPWMTVPTPNRSQYGNELHDVAVRLPSDAWAVGEYNPGPYPSGAERRTLTEHWNGTTWQVAASPNAPGAFVSSLQAVATSPDGSVWAVGYGDGYGTLQSTTLILRRIGGQWSQVSSPNPSGTSLPNRLYDLAVVAPNDIWAVGEQDFRTQGPPYRALVLHWDGTSWRNVPTTCGGSLYGVTVVGSGDVWAVGDATTCRYKGQGWTRIPPAQSAGFLDVSGVSPNFVWAVGRQIYCDAWQCLSTSVIERWDGSKWTVVPHPLFSSVNGVRAVSTTEAWAVGDSAARGASLRWNGSKWTQVPVPSTGNGSSLAAIERIGSTGSWAVGRFYGATGLPRTWAVRR